MIPDKIELIAVFKQPVELEDAQALLRIKAIRYRTGMDSSRGKLYFYSTGPKFILTFLTDIEKTDAKAYLEALTEIHEVYTPDWDKCKD